MTLTLTQDRLSADEALHLLRTADLFELGIRANQVRERYHDPAAPVTFVIDKNINYTNVCNVDCLFCAFYRHEGDSDAYWLNYDQIAEKAQGLVDVGGTQLLMQGGLNESIPWEYYPELIRRLRQSFPTLTIHAFSPTEIDFFSRHFNKTYQEVLSELIDAGLSSIPGGGAEVLDDEVRKKVSYKKVNVDNWLHVMEAAHGLGLKTTATLMFGMVETDEHLIRHLYKIRDLQDRTGGFTAFIPWTFQPENTKLAKLPGTHLATGTDYLRMVAMGRIVLDNIPNIQSSWLTQGLKLCQTALHFGANDAGGLFLEENVVTEAGIPKPDKSVDDLIKIIHNIGKDAAQRDTAFNILKTYPRPSEN